MLQQKMWGEVLFLTSSDESKIIKYFGETLDKNLMNIRKEQILC